MQNSHGELRMERNCKESYRHFSILHEVSLVEGMKELMSIYHVIGKIPAVRNISNKNSCFRETQADI